MKKIRRSVVLLIACLTIVCISFNAYAEKIWTSQFKVTGGIKLSLSSIQKGDSVNIKVTAKNTSSNYPQYESWGVALHGSNHEFLQDIHLTGLFIAAPNDPQIIDVNRVINVNPGQYYIYAKIEYEGNWFYITPNYGQNNPVSLIVNEPPPEDPPIDNDLPPGLAFNTVPSELLRGEYSEVWIISDDDIGLASMKIEIYDGAGVVQKVCNESISGTSYILNCKFTVANGWALGAGKVVATSIDSANQTTKIEHNFVLTDPACQAFPPPAITAPTDGATVDSLTPRVECGAVVCDENSPTYRFRVAYSLNDLLTGETNECEKCIYNDTSTNPYLDIPASLNLPYGTVVFVQVRAGAPGIGGLWSEVISFTTPDAPNIVIYDWIKGLWTTCNPVCGTSCEESRLITCADSNGNIVADSNCTETKPDTTRSHDGPVCTYSWNSDDEWGICGSDCRETRNVYCQADETSVTVDDSNCAGFLPPSSSRICTGGECLPPVTYEWTEGIWTTCNPACGTSCEESRSVTCEDNNGNTVADSNCTETKPDITRSHYGPVCVCDSENLNLCNSDDCSAASGYWYNGICNIDPEPACEAFPAPAITAPTDGATVDSLTPRIEIEPTECDSHSPTHRFRVAYSLNDLLTGETNECEKCIYNDTTTNPYLDIPASLNLPYGTVVFVQVRAGAPGIGGLWSEVISFTTPDAPNIVIYDWIKGLWTTCNPACGNSCEESRLITCADSNGNIVADSNCTETKPDTTRSHDGPACACDSENLNLCNSDDCSAAGGYWYNDTCNDASEGESEENCLPTSGVVYHFYHYLTEEMEIDAGRCLGRVNSEYNELENDEVIVFENVVIEYNRQDYMVYWETRSVYFNTRGIPDSSGNSVTIYSPRPDGGYTKGNLVIGWVKNYEQEGASEGWDIQVEFSNDKGVIYNTKPDYLFFGESDHFEVTPELHDRIFSGQSSQAYVYVQVIAYDKKTQEIKLYSNRVRFTIHPESDGGEEVPVIFGKASVQDFIVKYNNGELSTQSDKGMSRVKVDAAMYEGTPIAKLGKRIINGDIFKNVYVYAESVLLASVWAKSSAVHKTWKLNLGLSAVSTTGEKLTAWLYGMVYKIGTRAAVAFVVCDFAAENYCSKSLWNGLKWAYFKLADEVDESIAFTVFKEDFVYFFQGTPEYLSENLDKWRLYRLRLYLTTNGQQVSEFLEVAIDDTYGFIETALQRKQIDDPDVIGIADRFIKLTGYKPVEPWVEPLIEDEKYTISINPGWNLVSAYSVIDPAEVFTGVVSVWKWKENTWAYYLPEILPPGFETLPFETLKTINPGEGFWVNSEIATSYTLSVEIDPNAQTVLAPGWNLIGTADDSPITVDWLESKYDNIVSIWKWVDNNWEVYLPQEEDKGETYAKSKGFQALNVINLGEGFWVDCE